MNITEIIVHRGNSPVNTNGPLEQVEYYANAGFNKIEIDIYALSEITYKFCHPLDRDKIDEVHTIEDGFLEKVVKRLPDVEWYVDLKCLDLDEIPTRLLMYLVDVFGDCGVITAAQSEIIDFAHKAKKRTAQYFKDNINPSLGFAPDLFVQNHSENKKFQKANTMVYCPDPKVALEYLKNGYAAVMVDGSKLING